MNHRAPPLSPADAHNILGAITHLLCDVPRLSRFLPPPEKGCKKLERLSYYYRSDPRATDSERWRQTERKVVLLQVEQELVYVSEQGVYTLAVEGTRRDAVFELLFVIGHFRKSVGDECAEAWMLENCPSVYTLYGFIMRELAAKDAEKQADEVPAWTGVLNH